MIFPYDKTDGFNCDDYNAFSRHIKDIPKGIYEIEVRKPIRTSKQNRTIHALFEDLAVEMNGLGIEIKMGNFITSWTPETAKIFFKECYLAGKGTSECTTKQLSNAIEKLIFDVTQKGGQLSIKNAEAH